LGLDIDGIQSIIEVEIVGGGVVLIGSVEDLIEHVE
jgi:hypothetical protein